MQPGGRGTLADRRRCTALGLQIVSIGHASLRRLLASPVTPGRDRTATGASRKIWVAQDLPRLATVG